MVDLLTSAVDEARELSPEEFSDSFDSNPLVASELSTEDIVSSVNRAVLPEWIQAQVEEAFDQIGRYLNGERDEFTLTIQAGERVPTVVAEIKGLLRKADAYGLLFDEVITPAIDDALANELPPRRGHLQPADRGRGARRCSPRMGSGPGRERPGRAYPLCRRGERHIRAAGRAGRSRRGRVGRGPGPARGG